MTIVINNLTNFKIFSYLLFRFHISLYFLIILANFSNLKTTVISIILELSVKDHCSIYI